MVRALGWVFHRGGVAEAEEGRIEVIYDHACTRSEWLRGEASTCIHAYLPQRSLAFARVHPEDRAPGALHVHHAGQSGNARNFPPSDRPPFQEKKGGPKDGGLKDKIRFGLCSYCDARGCQNADDPKAVAWTSAPM